MSKRNIVLTLIVVILAAAAGYSIYKDSRGEDPFAGVNAQSYGTQGKVTAIESDNMTLQAAVSTKKGDTVYIDYETRKFKINSDTKIYRIESGLKFTTDFSKISTGSEVIVTSAGNPNSKSAELEAQEISIMVQN